MAKNSFNDSLLSSTRPSNRSLLLSLPLSLTIAFVFLGSTQSLADTHFSFGGYVKSFAVAQSALDVDNLPEAFDDFHTQYQSQSTLRLVSEAFTGKKIAWQLHYEISPVFLSNNNDASPFGNSTATDAANTYRISDINGTLGSSSSSKKAAYQNLDRINVQFNLEAGDLTIGRQAISLGSARVINPTDVFLPFKPTTLNQEYRTGIDMIRFQKPTGDLSEMDMGIVLGTDAKTENSAAFFTFKNHWRSSDVAITAVRFAEQNLVGIGIESSIGDMGTWFETAWVQGDENYNRTSIGADYSLSTNVFGQIEYHYNGAGLSDPNRYAELAGHIGYQKGGIFLFGRHYLMPSISWTTTPLFTLSLSSIINVDDSSAFYNVTGAYSLGNNLGVDFGAYIFTGDHLSFVPTAPNIMTNSEYGSNSNLLYVSFRFYF
ncbi:MAG: hypothetical protein ACI92E_001954 [Oceanicoccus sp.]|jgi:hypothetical protein